MPLQYGCRNCNLTFQVGHYHGFSLPVKMYESLVCNHCGLMYHTEHTGGTVYSELINRVRAIVHYIRDTRLRNLLTLNHDKRRKIYRDYVQTTIKRTVAGGLVELQDTFWTSPSNDRNTIRVYRGFSKLLEPPFQYYEKDEKNIRREIQRFRDFSDVTCVNCKRYGQIGYFQASAHDSVICPRCRKPSIEIISAWKT